MKRIRIKINEKEHVHLLNVSDGRSITVGFGGGEVFITDKTEKWVIEEISRLRDVNRDKLIHV